MPEQALTSDTDDCQDASIEASVEPAYPVAALFSEGLVAIHVHGKVSYDHLFDEEHECVARAVDKRIQEFAAGRLCARAALSALGFPEAPLLPGPDRAPLWPDCATGSISHTDGYCVAVAGPTSKFAGLGIDAERIGKLQPSLWPMIFRPEEADFLSTLNASSQAQMATVMFTAKEAFYKCQFSVTRLRLDFTDVVVLVTDQTFNVALRGKTKSLPTCVGSADGRFTRDGDLIVSGIAI